jgi:hypothetical protein
VIADGIQDAFDWSTMCIGDPSKASITARDPNGRESFVDTSISPQLPPPSGTVGAEKATRTSDGLSVTASDPPQLSNRSRRRVCGS